MVGFGFRDELGEVGLAIPPHVVRAQGRVQTGVQARLLFRVRVDVTIKVQTTARFRCWDRVNVSVWLVLAFN